MNKALAIGAAVTLGLFALAFWLHGAARYDAGKADCQAQAAATAAGAATESAKGLEKAHNETLKMSPADIDADLAALGIMRADSDH